MFPKVLERNFDWHTELVPNKRKNVDRETLVIQIECQQNENIENYIEKVI